MAFEHGIQIEERRFSTTVARVWPVIPREFSEADRRDYLKELGRECEKCPLQKGNPGPRCYGIKSVEYGYLQTFSFRSASEVLKENNTPCATAITEQA